MTGRENSGKGGAMKKFCAPALAALLPPLLALAGCAGGHHHADAGVHNPAPFYCPDEQVLSQAQTVTIFQPGRQDVAARVTTAQISPPSGVCTLEKKKNAVLVTLNTSFLADNGPADNGAPLNLTWFASISQGDNIIQKTDYTQTLSFDGNSSTASATSKTVKIELPDIPDTQNTLILVGFEETPDQLAYAAAHPEALP